MKKNLFVALAACVAIALSACGSKSMITMGDESKMDTLSYAFGSNVGAGMKQEFSIFPLDDEEILKGIEEALFEKSDKTEEEIFETLRDYFMGKAQARMANVYEKRRLEDSTRLAAGDSTVVEYGADPSMFETEEERHTVSHFLGIDLGNNLKASGQPIQYYWLAKGFRDTRSGNGQMTEEEIMAYLQHYFMVVVPARNAEESEAWLAKVEKKWGVEKTESGLLYKIDKKGDLDLKASDDRDVVVVKYEGTTREGKVFDSTYERVKEIEEQKKKVEADKELSVEDKATQLARLDSQLERVQTAEFPLNRVIPGWTEGMKLVGKGGKVTLWIPSELAYGAYGAGREIGPNEALRFDVEIIDVKPFEQPAPKPQIKPEPEPVQE